MGCRGWGNTELKYYNLRDMISETHDSGARLEVVIMNGDRERHTTKLTDCSGTLSRGVEFNAAFRRTYRRLQVYK